MRSVTDGRTDKRTDDRMMPIADRTVTSRSAKKLRRLKKAAIGILSRTRKLDFGEFGFSRLLRDYRRAALSGRSAQNKLGRL